MAYKVFDINKKKFAFGEERFSTQRLAELAVVDAIRGIFQNTDTAIYYFRNYKVRKVK